MRLTKFLFGLSDLCAWMLMTVAVLGVVALLFIGPGPDGVQGAPVSSTQTMLQSALWLLAALGAYLLTRRQPWGLFLALLPALLAAAQGQVVAAAIYAALVLVLFGTPLLLVWLEVRRNR